MMRRNFTLTDEHYAALLDASRAWDAFMWGSDGVPFCGTPQENANRAWDALGRELGFDPRTVQPGATVLEFSAEEAE